MPTRIASAPVVVELAVVGVDDRDRPRAKSADAADDVAVVVEDELAEAREFSVHRDVREVHRARGLVLVQRNREARGAAVLEVEVRVAVERLVERAVEADREHVRQVVVHAEAGARVADELVVEAEAPVGHQLEATAAQRVDLLDRVDVGADVLVRERLDVARLRTCRGIDLADAAAAARGGAPVAPVSPPAGGGVPVSPPQAQWRIDIAEISTCASGRRAAGGGFAGAVAGGFPPGFFGCAKAACGTSIAAAMRSQNRACFIENPFRFVVRAQLSARDFRGGPRCNRL